MESDVIEENLEKNINPFFDYASTLSPEDTYIVKQYTHHGDEIINAFLRGTDTIFHYEQHIYNPQKQTEIFFCLFLLEIAPEALPLVEKTDPSYVISKLSTSFLDYYTDQIYPIIEKKLQEKDITYFRNMVYNIVQKLYKIIEKCPKRRVVTTTSRGVKNLYLSTDKTKITKLNTFHSTTMSIDIAEDFGRKGFIYSFYIHPECLRIYTEPISLHPGEQEIVLAPGNRYIFLSDDTGYQEFAVLPPEKDLVFPASFTDFFSYLERQNNISAISSNNDNKLKLVRKYARMEGGSRFNKTRKRKARKGARKSVRKGF
jgi:hypothetical protein